MPTWKPQILPISVALAVLMPKKLEEHLKAQANKKGLKGPRKDAYVYGTMAKIKRGLK